MTTIRQIITDAYREGGLIGSGETLNTDQLDEGLRKLQTLVRSFFGNEIGVKLASVSYGINGLSNTYAKYQDVASSIDSSFVPMNVRLVCNLSANKEVFLHPNPVDGAMLAVVDNSSNFATNTLTLNGNGRKIEAAASVVLNANGVVKDWFYRADLGQWVEIEDFTVNSESPLPFKFDELLTTLLSLRLAPRFAASFAAETASTMQRMVKLFKAHYSQIVEMPVETALYRLTSDQYTNGRYYDTTTDGFNHGNTIG
jgi:hypothetical protein